MRRSLALVLALVTAIAACSRAPTGKPPGSPRVVVTIPPLAGLTQPLLPQGASITTIIPPTSSEHGHELTPRDMEALAKADIVVYVGLGLDPQVEAFLRDHPSTTRKDVEFAVAAGVQGPAEHTHREDDGHDHGAVDPHLWLDPDLCLKLVPALAQAIDAAAPGSSAAERGRELAARIRALDDDAKARLKPLAGRSLVTHHAAWERFARHYDLKIAAVIKPIETGEETNAAVEAAIKAIREQQVRAIFVEPQFSDAAAQRIAAATGVKVGKLDPLGDGDWFKLVRSNVDSLVSTLAPTSP